MKIYLASKSPRRLALLNQIWVDCECISVDIDESAFDHEDPATYVRRMALSKAAEGWQHSSRGQQRPLLAADTTVVYAGKILGKPSDKAEALATLTQLSGQTHQVMTSIVVTDGSNSRQRTSVTEVKFGNIPQQQLTRYIESNDCYDKAGAYGIQGYAARFVKSISGSYSGVVGLPLFETAELLAEFEV